MKQSQLFSLVAEVNMPAVKFNNKLAYEALGNKGSTTGGGKFL